MLTNGFKTGTIIGVTNTSVLGSSHPALVRVRVRVRIRIRVRVRVRVRVSVLVSSHPALEETDKCMLMICGFLLIRIRRVLDQTRLGLRGNIELPLLRRD